MHRPLNHALIATSGFARMGGDLWGTRGRSPKKFEVGDGPCIRSPNILRSMGCEAKYKLTKKRCQGGIFLSEIEVFGQENGGHVCYISYLRQNRVEKKVVRNFGW